MTGNWKILVDGIALRGVLHEKDLERTPNRISLPVYYDGIGRADVGRETDVDEIHYWSWTGSFAWRARMCFGLIPSAERRGLP